MTQQIMHIWFWGESVAPWQGL